MIWVKQSYVLQKIEIQFEMGKFIYFCFDGVE